MGLWADKQNSYQQIMSAAAMVVALLALTIYVYYDSLWYGFVYDDFPTIINYVHARTVDFWGVFLKSPRWVSRLLNQITYVAQGENPFWYRLVNLFIHLANGLLALVVVYKSTRSLTNTGFDRPAFFNALFVSMLLLLHPVQTQTVLYITQMRLEGIVLFCVLLTLAAVLMHARAHTKRRRLLALAIGLVGVGGATGSKEIAVILPALVALYDWFFIARGSLVSLAKRWHLYLMYGMLIGAAFVSYGVLKPMALVELTQGTLQNSRGNVLSADPRAPITLYPYALSQAKVIMHYLRIFLAPVGLSFDYDMRLASTWASTDVWLPTLLLLSLLATALYLYYRRLAMPLAFGICWFLVAVLPRASIFPTTELVCDYKTYVASFGVMVALAFVLKEVGRWLFHAWPMLVAWGAAHVRFAAACTLGLVLMQATGRRCTVWQDEYTFWKDVLDKAPKPRVINNFAVALWDRGQIDSAVLYFKQAVDKDPFYAAPHVNLGAIYQMRGDDAKALEHYSRAMEIGEGHPQLFNNLGMLHVKRGALEAAELCFKQAIALRDTTANAYLNLGRLYEALGRSEEALAVYYQATMQRVATPELLYAYGSLAYRNNHLFVAKQAFERLDLAYEHTAFMLGSCYYQENNYKQAARCFEQAYKKDPLNLSCIYNYAQSLKYAGRYREAANMYELCMTHEQEFPHVALHRITCLERDGQREKARTQLQALLQRPLAPSIAADALALHKQLTTC